MNKNGQITAEYILMISIILVILLATTNAILHETEKNTILTAAQLGAQTGIDKNGYAIYYNDTFNFYEENYTRLLSPTDIRIINITMEENKENITLQVNLHTNNDLTSMEKYIIGYRVNYYVRKSISETFDHQIENDTYYEKVETNNYKIETKTVKWV